MARYRKKPAVIEAVQWRGNNWDEILKWAGPTCTTLYRIDDRVQIWTLEGAMIAFPGDWIIRDVKGELYPCKPDVFDATYDPAEDGD